MNRFFKPRKIRAHKRTHRIEQLESRALMATAPLSPPIASIDGTGHNLANPEWGSTNENLLRKAPAEYGDGISTPAGADRPSPRAISNAVSAEVEPVLNDRHMSGVIYGWGQFLDHDIDLTLGATPAEAFNIAVPTGDPFFDPDSTGTKTIPLNRANFDPATGTSTANPRQQVNTITAFIDGSQVYGSDSATATSLRTLSGGKLKTSDGNLLPRDAVTGFFQTGDIRANENIQLLSFHTLFVREHNRLADQIAAREPTLTDEQIFQRARTLVMGELQAITFNEFLPALLGANAIRPYAGYKPSVNPGIANEFSTAAFRVGHTLLDSDVSFVGNDGTEVREALELREAFFNPSELLPTGIGPILKALTVETAREVDTVLVDDVRNFLFGPPGAGGLDLASLNIQRGRDHGLADYNATRVAYGLPRVTSFSQITANADLQTQLQSLYGSVDEIDLWIGGLAEDHVPGSSIGATFQRIIADQFTRLRDGDRFWFQNVLRGEQLRQVEKTTLAEVIRRNTEISNLQDNVFFDPSVLNFQTPGRPLAVTVLAGTGTIDIVKTPPPVRPGSPLPPVVKLASGTVGETELVTINGSNGMADRVTVDFSRGDLDLPDGVVVSGGEGPGDVLVIRATSKVDAINVTRESVTVNGRTIRLHGIEELQILTGDGDDQVVVADNLGIKVIVDGKPYVKPRTNSATPAPVAPTPRSAAPTGSAGSAGSATNNTTPRRPAPPSPLDPQSVDALFRSFGNA